MNNVLGHFRQWLKQTEPRLFEWLSNQAETFQDLNESFEPLPSELSEQLQQRLNALPDHPEDQCCLKAALEQAIDQWQTDPIHYPNCIAVLSSPVDSVASLLSRESLTELDIQLSIQILQWTQRPEIHSIQSKLEEILGQKRTGDEAVSCRKVVVIPILERCFLRSADGLDGIEYLRDTLLSDRSRFWILGTSEVSWQYLSKVCALDAHCTETFALPELTGEQLEDWLMPATQSLELPLEFQSNSLRGHFTEDDDDSLRSDYFKALSQQSGGNSLVAADLFLQSLAYNPPQTPANKIETDTNSREDSAEAQPASLRAQYPEQPELPSLSLDEKYLLYSILLHRSISIGDLAKSLGLPINQVSSQVQALKHKCILQKTMPLKLNNLYFSRIKRKLRNDNFLV